MLDKESEKFKNELAEKVKKVFGIDIYECYMDNRLYFKRYIGSCSTEEIDISLYDNAIDISFRKHLMTDNFNKPFEIANTPISADELVFDKKLLNDIIKVLKHYRKLINGHIMLFKKDIKKEFEEFDLLRRF